MPIFLRPYKMGSASIKMLQRAIRELGCKCYRSRTKGLTWGPGLDKLAQFKLMSDKTSCVPYTEYMEQAQAWIDKGYTVVCRTMLKSHSGAGIVIASTKDELVRAPLYTRYIKKTAEYRVHVIGEKVILIQKKMKKKEWDGPQNTQIRNLKNGYVFGKNIEKPPAEVEQVAVAACAAIGHWHGAVDVIWNQHDNKAYVLEVNAAPGLSPSTAQIYAQEIVERFGKNAAAE